jgi:multiple sugar transport system substrate-binding protein
MKTLAASSALALLAGLGLASAALADGEFAGVTIDAKLIGGQQYEALYARIPEWEAKTGAKVNIVSQKNHFELDKEFKADIAAGSITWCMGSNHSSFASQYPQLYTDMTPLVPAETIAGFVPAHIEAATLDGKLLIFTQN